MLFRSGRLASDLVRQGASFEAVAELLWTGLWHEEVRWDSQKPNNELRKLADSLASVPSSDQVLEIFALVILHLGIGRGSVAERIRGGQTQEAARQIIQEMVGWCGLVGRHGRYIPMSEGQSIAEGLMQSLGVEKTEDNRQSIEAMLILLADQIGRAHV